MLTSPFSLIVDFPVTDLLIKNIVGIPDKAAPHITVLHIKLGVPTDRQTDRPTDLPTHIVTYRAAEVQLNIEGM